MSKESGIFRIVFGVVLALWMQTGQAQSFPANQPPVTSEYCPSNTGGQCYKSRIEAETAMRAAEPDVGQFLVEKNIELSAYYSTIRYVVSDQPPAWYSEAVYGINTPWWVKGEALCPNSASDEGPKNMDGTRLCASEDELVQNYIANNMQPGPGYDCVNTNPRLVGTHILPYRYTSGGYLNQGEQGRPDQRGLLYTQTCKDWDGGTYVLETKAEIYRSQRFTCPPGFSPIDTSDVSRDPNLCRSAKTASISIRHTQFIGCTVGHPCNPATGDKVRAETDFVFAGQPFTRYYHSLRQLGMKNASMGAGWTHTYSSFMGLPGWMLKIVSGEGYFLPYRYVSTNRFAVTGVSGAPVGMLDKLADGTWKMMSADGKVMAFSGGGDLVSMSDPGHPEHDVTLSYESNSQGQPRLSKVMDAAGRELRFVYDSHDVLIGIHLPDGQLVTYGYDEHQNLVSVDYGNGQVKQYLYGEPASAPDGDQGLLTGIVSEDGQRYGSFTYDAYGRVIKSVLNGGDGPTESTEISYPNGNQSVVRTMTGEVRTYTYDASRKILSVSSEGSTESSVYNTGGWDWLDAQTDRNGNQTQYAYNSAFQQTQRIEASNDTQGRKRTIQTDWHATFNVPVERRVLDATNTLVAKTTWTYNARGQVLTTTQADPASGATRTVANTYCEQPDVAVGTCPRVGLQLSVDGARTDEADITRYTYYPSDDASCTSAPTTCPHRKGDLWKVTNALGHMTETLAYDGAGRPLRIKDANGVVTEMTYHPRGWLTSRTVKGATPATDRSVLIDYWPTGLVKRVTQPDGSYTQYGYDAAHRLTDIADSAGNTLHYTLDNAGNRTGEQTRDPSGTLTRSLSRVHDQLGRLQSQMDAYGQATTYGYDANGNTTTVTDALGRQTANAYDPLGRLVQTLQDVGGVEAQTQFAYDASDNLTRVTDPKGLHTDYTYNGLGDLVQLASPDTGITSYGYDSAGNRISQTDARGMPQTYSYDALNRLVRANAPTRKYSYDNLNSSYCQANERANKGRLSGLEDGSGKTYYCYNRFGDLTRKVQISNEVVSAMQYGYDAAGRPTTTTYPDGAVLDAVYDGNGQVAELGITPVGGSRQIVITGATYAPFGPATGWEYGNGRILLRDVNHNYQPVAIHDAGAGGLSLGYGYDAVGNLTALKDATQTTPLAQYGYDALNRLVQTQDGPTGTPIETYEYDATGNRQSVTNAGGTTSYAYAPGSHRLSQVGTATRGYDAAGNTTTLGGGPLEFGYDASGRLMQVKSGGVQTRVYRHNAKGELVRSYLGTDNLYFVYDEAGHLLGEYDATGSPKQQIVWLGDLPVGVLQGAGANQQLHYIEPDHLGTPRVVIDGSRDVPIWEWSLTGEAFGNTPPDQDPDRDGIVFRFDLRYPGQRYDAATGLNYNYFRDYDPATGRYAESDPIGLRGGISTYGYATQSPLTAMDPTGLAARLVDIPPANQRPAGSIYCVDGVIKPFFMWDRWPADYSQCAEVRDCIYAHEMSHVADAYRSNPNLCQKSPLHFLFGTPPKAVTFSTKLLPGSDLSELDVSELRAHAVELRCLGSKLRAMQCDSRCKAAVIRRIRQIIDYSLPAIHGGSYGSQ